MTDIMIDIETLGKFSDSVILSIGAVAFDENTEANHESFNRMTQTGFHVKLSVADQVNKWNRAMDDETMNWWASQDDDAKVVLKPSSEDVSLVKGLIAFNEWIKASGYDFKKSHCWCRGLYFDFPILQHAFHQIGILSAYNLWRSRDTRTVVDILSGSGNGYYDPKCGKPDTFIKHNAVHDCAFEILRIVDLLKG